MKITISNTENSKPEQQKPQSTTRRRAVFGAAAGVSFAAWHTPIVKSVILPAHAQTSPASPPPPPPAPDARVFNFSGGGITQHESQRGSLLDLLVPEANAGSISQTSTTFTVLAEETASGSDTFELTVLEEIENPRSESFTAVASIFKGTVAAPGSGSLALSMAGCNEAPQTPINAEIVSISEDLLELNLTNREAPLTLRPGSVTIGAATCTEIERPDFARFNFSPRGGQQGSVGADRSLPIALLDTLIPAANAQQGEPLIDVVAVNTSGASYQIGFQDGSARFSGTVDIDGASGSLSASESCPGLMPVPLNASLNSAPGGSAELVLFGGELVIPLEVVVNPVLPAFSCQIIIIDEQQSTEQDGTQSTDGDGSGA